jgi:O-antigen/teichoic acid export membrane protein
MALLVLLAGHLLPVLLVGGRTLREGLASLPKAWATLRDEWSLIGALLLSSVLLFVGLRAFPWLVELSLGTAAVANLGAALLVVGAMNPIINGLGNELSPRFARTLAEEGPASLSRALWRALGLYGVVLGILAAVIATLGPSLLDLLLGDKFPRLGGLIAILAVNTLLYGLVGPVTIGLITLERPGALSVSAVATAGFTLVGVPLLARSHGLLGAALAATMATAVLLICSLAVFMRAARWRRQAPPKPLHSGLPGLVEAPGGGAAEIEERPTS